MIVAALVLATAPGLGGVRAEQSAGAATEGSADRNAERGRLAEPGEGGAGRDWGWWLQEQMREWDLHPGGAGGGGFCCLKVATATRPLPTATGEERPQDRGGPARAQRRLRKVGAGGRAELSAFFLDELMLPEEEGGVGGPLRRGCRRFAPTKLSTLRMERRGPIAMAGHREAPWPHGGDPHRSLEPAHRIGDPDQEGLGAVPSRRRVRWRAIPGAAGRISMSHSIPVSRGTP